MKPLLLTLAIAGASALALSGCDLLESLAQIIAVVSGTMQCASSLKS